MQALKTRFATPLLFPLTLLLGAPFAVAAPTHHSAAARGIGSAPAGLVAAIAHTQAQEVAKNPAYAIGRHGCAQLKARNNTPVLTGCFGRTGPAFSTGKQTLRLQLSAWGRAGQLRPVALTRTTPQANRIEYRGRHISEWWRVLPLGYEQGFTIEQAPAGTGKVVLELTASRAPRVELSTLVWGKLRYGKLQVTDAADHVLPATLSAQGKIITLAFDAAHARYPVTVDPLVWVQQEVTAADGAAYDEFSYSVALSSNGTTALVGANYKTIGGNSDQGAAYVYTLANGTWSQAAELTASDGAAGDYFGQSVMLSANGATALVGASNTVGPNSQQGAAYVFTTTNNWSTNTQQAELTASDGAAGDFFGTSVALSGNGTTALVGANAKNVSTNTDQGAAYVFTTTDNWSTNTQQAELTAANGAANDLFGTSVALSGNGTTALIGAGIKTVAGNYAQGAVYVYTLTDGTWSQAAELTASDGAAGDNFGHSVALSANGATALVGAWGKTVGTNSAQGAAYVYTAPGGGWVTTSSYTAELTASNGAANDRFGTSVALSTNGTTALVGAYGGGAAYGYTESNGSWSQAGELTDAANDNFGTSVALSGDGATVLVGAYNKTIGGNPDQGAAYFFTGSDLSAVLSAPATVVPNAQFDSQYILTNASTTASAALTVMLPLPATGASYVSASASQGTCSYDSTAKVATCGLGSIPGNGGTASAILTLKATGALGSAIAQSGQLTNGSPDLAQTASTTISPPPPAVSETSNLTVGFGKSGTETFTIAGTGTLTLTATSSNTTLLPDANITGASSCTAAGNCTLTLTPATGQSGTAKVPITVTDNYGQSGSGSFTLTVKAAPAPTSGGGALGLWALAVLLGLTLLAAGWRRRQSV